MIIYVSVCGKEEREEREKKMREKEEGGEREKQRGERDKEKEGEGERGEKRGRERGYMSFVAQASLKHSI